MEDNLYKDYMEDVRLNDERDNHFRVGFENNNGGIYDKKSLIHANRWYIYIIDK